MRYLGWPGWIRDQHPLWEEMRRFLWDFPARNGWHWLLFPPRFSREFYSCSSASLAGDGGAIDSGGLRVMKNGQVKWETVG